MTFANNAPLESHPPIPDPNEAQRRATTPQKDIWVAASAGSGKTKVLTDRVLRLMLPDPKGQWEGAEPHKILCITFTKAAAALMAIRIQNKLGEWTTMSEEALHEDIRNLVNADPTPEMLQAARQLFSKVLDTPGGLSIMTIHSFCQSTLARFPLESGLTPGFKVLDEVQSAELMSKTLLSLITDLEKGNLKELEAPFDRLALLMDFDQLRTTLAQLLDKMEDLERLTKKYGTGARLEENLRTILSVESKLTPEEYIRDFIAKRPIGALKDAALKIADTNKTNGKLAESLLSWLSLNENDRITHINLFLEVFLKKDLADARKLTGKIEQNFPDIADLFMSESKEIFHFLEQQASMIQCEQTADLIDIAQEGLIRYRSGKRRLNALDFSDMILKTRQLLEHSGQEWVHFKLDEGIDHILVDEAQDTNPHQWQIIRHLSAEFLSGWGRENHAPRSIFVVGDKKQSIFSFHGADPESFAHMKNYFEQKSQEAGRSFEPVNLQTSFRTSPPVLKLVDTVFKNPELALGLGIERSENLEHFSFHHQDSGLIELWGLDIQNNKNSDKRADQTLTEHKWKLPFLESSNDQALSNNPDSSLANKIALKISSMVHNGELLKRENRPIRPKDIIILVRTRTGGLVHELIRQLKLNNIEVSGIDRMTLNDQIAIQDCLALARFVRLPQDDLSLACVLKSPFIRISEDDLMNWSIKRKTDQSLWESMQAQAPKPILDWLTKAIANAQHLSPFNFFDSILTCACPYDQEGSSRRAFSTLLGTDCLDPLDEFLSYCLQSEQNGILSLEDLVTSLEKSNITIKRELEATEKEGGDQVRIMTVHASKGLEAPIVFIPDTMSKPGAQKIDKLLWITDTDNTKIPLWSASSKIRSPQYQQARTKEIEKAYQEYLRLLYVALTRARERLYICGKSPKSELKESDTPVWYQLIESAFNTMKIGTQGDALRTWETQQKRSIGPIHRNGQSTEATSIPAYLFCASDTEEQDRRFIRPSLIGRGDPAISPLEQAENFRFERGILTHKLFEFLPDILPERRESAAYRFLEKNGSTLPEKTRAEIAKEVLNVMNSSDFAKVFGKDSLAEVSVTGEIAQGKILSGQIDRLVVLEDRILIVDFKTNRPSPLSAEQIPEEYKNQLRAYKSAISKIYTDKPIHCALLWTDRAHLMPVEI
ncbi:MAG: double-strand break repair helicase AddA [Alphaproteobacteria bacterium]|nr:double-strand break repair helicase AddA [Alphaproteobacteria bacterium]